MNLKSVLELGYRPQLRGSRKKYATVTVSIVTWCRAMQVPVVKAQYLNKGKDKVRRRTGHEGPEGELRRSYTLSLTSVLDGGGYSKPHSGRCTSGKNLDPMYRRLGGPQGRSGQVRKIPSPPGFDLRTVQPIASRCTD